MDKKTEALADAAGALVAYFDRVGTCRDEEALVEALRAAITECERQNNGVMDALRKAAQGASTNVCEVCLGRGRARESFERCAPCKGTGIYPPIEASD